MKAVVFDGAIPRYLLTRAVGALSSRALTGPLRCTALRDVPTPELPGERWVRVRTRLGGICGSDLNLIQLHVSPSASPFSSFPFVVGHENIGMVVDTGPGVTRVTRGDRVVTNPLLPCAVRGVDPACPHCRSGYAARCEHFTDGALAPGMMLGTTRGLGGSWGEEFVAHESQLAAVPPAMSDKTALLVEPFACVLSPLLENPPPPDSRVLVIGAGSMGLLAAAALRAVNDADTTVLARYAFQAELAERLGAHRIVLTRNGDYASDLSRITGGRLLKPILGPRIHVGGFDATVVCVGTETAVSDALRFTRAGGTVILLANVAALRRVDWTPLWMKELTIRGSLCYNAPIHGGSGQDAFARSAALLASPLGARLEALVTHTFPLEDFRSALHVALERAGNGAVKVALAV